MDYVVLNESSRPPRPARLLGHGAHGLRGYGPRAGSLRLRLLRDRSGLLCHSLPLSAPFLPRSGRVIRDDPRRTKARDFLARQFALRATDR
jgi:hypothetical protein